MEDLSEYNGETKFRISTYSHCGMNLVEISCQLDACRPARTVNLYPMLPRRTRLSHLSRFGQRIYSQSTDVNSIGEGRGRGILARLSYTAYRDAHAAIYWLNRRAAFALVRQPVSSKCSRFTAFFRRGSNAPSQQNNRPTMDSLKRPLSPSPTSHLLYSLLSKINSNHQSMTK